MATVRQLCGNVDSFDDALTLILSNLNDDPVSHG